MFPFEKIKTLYFKKNYHRIKLQWLTVLPSVKGFKTNDRKQTFENWPLLFRFNLNFSHNIQLMGHLIWPFFFTAKANFHISSWTQSSPIWPEVCLSRPHYHGHDHPSLSLIKRQQNWVITQGASDIVQSQDGQCEQERRDWLGEKPKFWIVREQSRNLWPIKRVITVDIFIGIWE